MSITRKEIYQAKTYEALLELARKHGRDDASSKAWARKIIDYRNKKRG